jgi:hypothetical protein
MARRRSNLKIMGFVITAVLAFSAVTASAASARTWTIAGSNLFANAPIQCENSFPTWVKLTSKVGEIAVVLEFPTLTCSGVLIENWGGFALGSGKLQFGLGIVSKPKNCSVLANTTNALKIELIEPAGDGANRYQWFRPASGEEITTVGISGGSCAVAGNYPLKGSIAGKGLAWGTEVVEQPLTFSAAIDAVTGKKLTFGGEPATLEGDLISKLSAGNLGKKWGAK